MYYAIGGMETQLVVHFEVTPGGRPSQDFSVHLLKEASSAHQFQSEKIQNLSNFKMTYPCQYLSETLQK